MQAAVDRRLKFHLLIFSTLYLLLPFSSTLANPVKYCDKKSDYAVKVQGVEISPQPVVSGQPATFNISASTDEAIDGGKVVIEVSYFGIHVHTEEQDLCEKSECPIDSGNFVLSHSQTLPALTPPGSYTLKMTIKDKSNKQLTCITFNFKIGFGSSLSE